MHGNCASSAPEVNLPHRRPIDTPLMFAFKNAAVSSGRRSLGGRRS